MTKTEKKTARKVAKARREERRRCVNIACAFLHILTLEEELRDVLCVELVQHADTKDRAEKAEAALRDMEAARDEQTRMKMETCRALDKERDAAEAKVATARAVMAEEAARKSESYGEIGMRPAREIRALAPLPAGLVVLSAELVGRAATWIGEAIPALENGAEYNEEIARELFTTLRAAIPEGA